MNKLKSALAAATVSMFALAPMAANAALSFSVDDLADGAGTNVVTVADNAATDADADLNSITSLVNIGAWKVNTTGLGAFFTGAGPDLNSIAASSSSGGSVTLKLTETNLNFGAAGLAYVIGIISGNSAAGNGSISWALYADDTNAAFGTQQLAFSGSAPNSSFNLTGGNWLNLTDPFSMTLVVTITHAGKAATSFDFASSIPEPATLSLLGAALLGAGAAARRRKAA